MNLVYEFQMEHNMSKTVLLIEDNRASQTLMKMAFKTAEMDCMLKIAEEGDDAIAFLKRQGVHADAPQTNLVLLDLNLPGKSGVEILAEIKQDPATSQVPVIVLTGSNASSDMNACAKYPHCRYVLKPARFPELVDLVRSFQDEMV
jgi:CheY-like chemotaxis protein